MLKIFSFISLVIIANSLCAKEHYVYKASIFKVLNAKLIIDVEDGTYNNVPVVNIKSNSNIHFLGNEIVNLDYLAHNDVKTFEPQLNIECEHSKKQGDQNCRSVKFLPQGQFLYKESHNDITKLEDIESGSLNVTLMDIITQQPTYNPNEHKIYDIASIVLLIKYLDISKDHRDIDLFIAINKQMMKVRISYVQDIDENQMWIKLIPLNPGPEEFKGEFPHKIVFDKRLKTVTEIHKKLPYVGDVVIKLDKKASRF
jgi:hypothetical protein